MKNVTGQRQETKLKAENVTMNFEGFSVAAKGEKNISQVISTYTELVSIDESTSKDDIKRRLKTACHKYNDDNVNDQRQFDHTFMLEMEGKVQHIESELQQNMQNYVDANNALNNAPFSRKEFKLAIKSLRSKQFKSCGLDGVENWMILKAGKQFRKMLLHFYNEMWSHKHIPDDFYETLISYIYKNKGNKDEITSYRPIALNSTIINLFKKMCLTRLVQIIMPNIMENQGGFRKGISSKEQLWAVTERMMDANSNGQELYACATDVHKAFDQVYRSGTVYLLYAYGVRGTLLTMVMKWIRNNVATPLWRGIKGERIVLNDNGLRQGCTLSPLLYISVNR
jgi:hypothetical protein